MRVYGRARDQICVHTRGRVQTSSHLCGFTALRIFSVFIKRPYSVCVCMTEGEFIGRSQSVCVFIEYAYAVCVAVCGCFRRAELVSVGVCFGTSSETVAALVVGMSAKMFKCFYGLVMMVTYSTVT